MKRNIFIIAAIVIVSSGLFASGWLAKEVQIAESDAMAVSEPEEKQSEMDSLFNARYPEYQVYGMHQEKDRQRRIVDHLYKFRFTIVAGCVVDDEIVAEANKVNQETNKIMTGRYGKDWLQKFERSVDSLYSLDSLAIDIAKSSRYFKKLEADSSRIFNFKYFSYPTHNDNIKLVRILGDERNTVGTTYDYLRITIDINKKKILNVDNQAYESRY